jgi:hypothetical protein
MTTDHSASAEKRQAILQQIRERHGSRQKSSNNQQDVEPRQNLARSNQQTRNNQEKALPIDFLKNVQQWINSPEIEPNSTSLQELEQRKQELQYRSAWLLGLLEVTQKELNAIQEHIKIRTTK